MKTRTISAAAVIALTFIGAAWAEEFAAVQKKIVEAAGKVTSFSAEMTMDMQTKTADMSMTSKSTGTVEFARKADKMLSRMEMKGTTSMKFGDTDNKTEQNVLTVCDGEYVYNLMDQGGQKTATKMKVDPGNSPVATRQMFETLTKDFDIKVLPDEKISGRDTYAIEATPKKAEEGAQKLVQYFCKESGMLVKFVALSPDGKPLSTMTYTNIKTGADIKPDRFVFKAPAGVDVMDMTQAKAPEEEKKEKEETEKKE